MWNLWYLLFRSKLARRRPIIPPSLPAPQPVLQVAKWGNQHLQQHGLGSLVTLVFSLYYKYQLLRMFADQRHWEIQNHSVPTYGSMLYSWMCMEPRFLVMYATEWFGCFAVFYLTNNQKAEIIRTWHMKVLCSKECTAYRPLACGALSLFIMCYHMVVCNCVWSQEGKVLSSLRGAPLVNPLAWAHSTTCSSKSLSSCLCSILCWTDTKFYCF